MIRIVPVLILLAAAPAWSAQPEGRPLAFTHVTVIDTGGGAAKSNVTVTVVDGRITGVGPSVAVPRDAQVVDAKGKFLIPGLWDMHTHLGRKEYLALFLANGVTGARFMNRDPAYLQWRREIDSGTLTGPRMVIGVMVDGPKPVNPQAVAVSNEAEARQAVIDVRQSGADFVKVYSLLPRDLFYAIADEAKKQGIAFAGHVPRSVTPAEASDAGQKSIEHLSGIAFQCSSLEPQYQSDLEQLRADVARVGAQSYYYLFLRRLEGKYLDAYDAQRCAALFARFKKHDTWQVPTLRVTQSGAWLADPSFVNPGTQYMPAQRRETDPRKSSMYRNFTPADFATLQRILDRNLEIVGAMQRAGVKILAGTDVHPLGFTLHDELELLVKAGLTPLQALQAATLGPARYLGRDGELGTIEQGKLADLVLLDADPLADIRNTRKIDAVVVRGRLLDRTALDRMLTSIKALRGQP